MKRVMPAIVTAFLTVSLSAADDMPSFDTGMEISFNAEANENVAYEMNPACITYFDTHTILMNFGGDLSFGKFEFSVDEGSTDPGSTPGDGEAFSVSYTLGTSVKGISAFRLGKHFVAGLGSGYDYNGIRLGYNGQGFSLLPYYYLDPGFNSLEVKSNAYHGTGIIGLEFGKLSVGASINYYDGKDDFELTHVYYESTESHGVRGLNNMTARVGVQYRSENFEFGFAPGYAILKNNITWDHSTVMRDWAGDYIVALHEGASNIDGNGYIGEADARFKLADNFGLGFGFGARLVPKITAGYSTTDYDSGVPIAYGGRDLGEGKEYIYKARTGFAFYPDDKTTLAFDYNADIYKASFDYWNEYGVPIHTYELKSRVTYTQLGAERWITDDLEAKLGWRQNIYTLPRNVLFAGVQYNVTDSVNLAYDYMGEYIGISNFSLFTPLSELIHPGSHKLTLALEL